MTLLQRFHRAYKFCISPLFGNVCRFEPCCSDYMLEACDRFGFVQGALLSMWRLARCHPWATGGSDPVPLTPPILLKRFSGR